ELVSTDESFATASIVKAPGASGSGNAATPLRRMHSPNFTAFARGGAALLIPLLTLAIAAVLSPPPLRVPPQPALIATVARPNIATAATALVFHLTSGHPFALR